MAHSDRAGPGVLLLERNGSSHADALSAEGFTVLVPEGDFDEDRDSYFQAAADYLSANWHPRLGVIAVGDEGGRAADMLLGRTVPFDVLVLYNTLWSEGSLPPSAVVGHFAETFDRAAMQRAVDALSAAGAEPELYLYPGTSDAFYDPASPTFSQPASALAEERTRDALEYFLS